MKFVHSFWSKPLLYNKFNMFDILLPVILHDYAYSVACIKKYGHSIRLIADKEGAELLSFLPYDDITVIEHDDWSVHFAAQIKFEALKRMSLDEYLIDGDLFLQKPECFNYIDNLQADFIYSLFEPNSYILDAQINVEKYKLMHKIFKQHIDIFLSPYNIDRFIEQLEWPNTSLMKFNNEKLKQEYIRQYEYHRDKLKDIDFYNSWPDIIIEQRHMKKLLDTGYTSLPVIDNFPNSASNDFALKIGFTHLGHYKVAYDDHIVKFLREMNKDLYEETLKQIEKYTKNNVTVVTL